MKKFALIVSALVILPSALGVELLIDDRRVQVFSTNGSSTTTPTAPFADFSVTGQTTSFTAEGFAGSGSGYGESDFDFFIRESIFDVTFAAAAGTEIALTGSATANAGDFGLARLEVDLFAVDDMGGQSTVYEFSLVADSFKEVFDTFAFTETLATGNYRFVIYTSITPGGFDTYADFNFDVTFTPDLLADSDGDGITDVNDNCTNVANASQFDGDSDGYGNACDADFNNDCVVNTADLGLMRVSFFSNNPNTDLNEDGVVNIADLGALRAAFFGVPGPSGVAGVCTSAR